jgi:hypothetical protein
MGERLIPKLVDDRRAYYAKFDDLYAVYLNGVYDGKKAAQRPWVGLTDEESQLIYDMGRTPTGMMEMVEAMLKDKNNGTTP